MTPQEILEKAQKLSVDEQKQLIKLLVDHLGEPPQEAPKKQRSLREFRGAAAHLYDGTDAQEYVNKLRSEWDARP